MNSVKIALVLSTILVSACSITSSRLHPTLSEELKNIEKVAIVPPAINIELVTLTGENERLTTREAQFKDEIMAIATRELTEGGYQVVKFNFDSLIAEDKDFSLLVTGIRNEFDQVKKELQYGKFLSTNEANKIRVSVGEAVNIVASKSGADAVLLIRYDGVQQSDGQIIKSIGAGLLPSGSLISAIYSASHGSTEAVLIDGVTGDVLWTDVRQGTLSTDLTDLIMDSMPDDIDVVDSSSDLLEATSADSSLSPDKSTQTLQLDNTSNTVATVN